MNTLQNLALAALLAAASMASAAEHVITIGYATSP